MFPHLDLVRDQFCQCSRTTLFSFSSKDGDFIFCLLDICCSIRSRSHVNSWSPPCVTSNRHTHSLEVSSSPVLLMLLKKTEFTSRIYVCLTGKRPFGVSLLYMGWDKHYGFQLYQSDPSGNYGGWKATCIGNNSAVSLKFK